jgi:hypothetical protein
MLALSLPPPAHLFSRPDRGDLREYFDYANRTFDGQVPYRDFSLEYPPGFVAVMLAPGPANRGYFDRFRALMLVLSSLAIGLLAFALLRVGAGAADLAAGVLVLASLPRMLSPGLVFERFDVWPTVLVLLAAATLLTGRRTLGLASLGFGAATKIFPLVLVPLALLTKRGTAHVRRELAVVISAALIPVLPFFVIAPFGVAHVGKLLVRRPLQIESLGGSVLLAAHRLGLYKPTIYISFAQSWDLAGPAAKAVAIVTSLAEAAALAAVWVLFARGPRGQRELLLAVAAAVVGFVAFGKVLSPQYLVWVAATVPLALGRARPFALVATVVVALLTRYIYLWGYDELVTAGRVSWVMLARNVLLVAVFASLLLELAARRESPARRLSAAGARPFAAERPRGEAPGGGRS